MLTILTKDKRPEFRTKILEKTGEAGWKIVEAFYDHHLLFEVSNPQANVEAQQQEDEEDLFDLSGL